MDFYQGIDLLDIRRIRKVYSNYGKKFIHKIFSKSAIGALNKRFAKQRLIEKISSAYAVKEAASKALGTGFREGVSFADFELFYDSNNRPFININPKIDKRFRRNSTGKVNSFVSISNEKNFVIAIVTIISS